MNNPVRTLIDNNVINKKRKVSANKSNHSTNKGRYLKTYHCIDGSYTIEGSLSKIYKSSKRVKSKKITKLSK